MGPARLDLDLSFFILEVGVLLSGGLRGMLGSDLSFSSFDDLVIGVEVERKLSVVLRLENEAKSDSNVSFLACLGLSDSGVLDEFEADLRAFIQLFLIPCVTADNTYCLSSKVETIKP